MYNQLREIIEHYGVNHQKMVACEELGELIQAISKSVRYPETYDIENLKGEMADVFVVLQELMLIHNIEWTNIIAIAFSKIERQKKRMEEEDLKCQNASDNI